jgi:hypothetical protein
MNARGEFGEYVWIPNLLHGVRAQYVRDLGCDQHAVPAYAAVPAVHPRELDQNRKEK